MIKGSLHILLKSPCKLSNELHFNRWTSITLANKEKGNKFELKYKQHII